MKTQQNNSIEEEIKKFTNIMATSLNPSNDTMNAVRYVRNNLSGLIRLAEQSLVGRVREEIENIPTLNPNDISMNYTGGQQSYLQSYNDVIKEVLNLPILKSTTPDGDNQ